jgi:ribosomal protein S18 acetylase RimI-like enzyme
MLIAELEIVPATSGDAGEILTLQRAAYQSEALLYGDPALPPLVQTLSDLVHELDEATALKAVRAGRIIGSVRARIDGTVGHIARLVVAPDVQGGGLGTRLMHEIETRLYDRVQRFELFTGARSEGNLRLYTRLGYREVRRTTVTPALTLIYLAKDARAPIAPT